MLEQINLDVFQIYYANTAVLPYNLYCGSHQIKINMIALYL